MTVETNASHQHGAPLAGRSVVITRTREQAASLAEPLEAFGAEVLAMPVLAVVDPPDPSAVDAAIAELTSYDWVVLTSTNAVDRFFARLVFVDRAAEALSHVKIAAVGRATAAHLRVKDVEPDLVPDDARAEGLVAAFGSLGVGEGCRVLVPRALKAREVFPDALRAMGAEVDVVPVYQTVAVEPAPEVLERLRAGSVDCVSFTSGAIAEAFFSAIRSAGIEPGALMAGVAVASIGPVTTEALKALGYKDDIEAEKQTMASLAQAIADYFVSRP
ncbi:MAG: uroporphyrinogen-III synthase [Coriobacteriia bacterium]|nr:uroporphyrinogen-III synthase [Coriobacteriia bacterium]